MGTCRRWFTRFGVLVATQEVNTRFGVLVATQEVIIDGMLWCYHVFFVLAGSPKCQFPGYCDSIENCTVLLPELWVVLSTTQRTYIKTEYLWNYTVGVWRNWNYGGSHNENKVILLAWIKTCVSHFHTKLSGDWHAAPNNTVMPKGIYIASEEA